MRDARTGGNTKPQLISEHGAGQKANKKPRPFHAAALKQADAHERKQKQVQRVVDNYAANPRESARKLHQLGMTPEFIRTIHKSSVVDKRTEPAPGVGHRIVSGLQETLDTVGLSGAAHPVRRLEHPGGRMEFPGFGKIRDLKLGGLSRRAKGAVPKATEGAPRPPITNRNVTPAPEGDFFGERTPPGGHPKPPKEMKFPDEMPGHVQSAAGRLASQLDKESVKALRKEQERLHTEERGKRAQVAHAAMLKYAGTEKASRIAKSKLAGEMPKVPVSKVLGEMSTGDLNVLRKYIHTNPRMQFFEKLDVENALEKGLSGHPPTTRERELLHKAFGKEFATRLEMPSLGTKVMRGAKEVANLPRSIESAGDVSATLRQNLVAAGYDPIGAAKDFGPGLKAFASKDYAAGRLRAIEQRPNYKNGFYQRGKVALTDIGDSPAPHEELFPSTLGDKIPLVKQSGRSFTDTTVNRRVNMFDKNIARARKKGVDVEDNHFLESLGSFVNSATGRGDLGSLEGVGKVLNATLFSPRLLKSRLDFLGLNPAFYAKMHPYVRVQAARAALQTIAGGVFILELANKAGAGVELDPRSTDFGKARFGSTRIDVWGGFQPIVRTIAQVATGERKTTTTGDIVKLDGKFGHSTRLDTLFNFAVGKAAPVPSIGLDLLRGKTFVGQPVTLKGELQNRAVPFGIQDAVQVGQSKGSVLKGAGAFGLSAVGVGVQDYTNDPSKVAKKAHDDLSKAFEANLQHYYKIGLTPQIKKALKLREARAVYLAKNLGGNASPLDRYNAQIDLAVKLKLITPKQGHGAKSWATKQDEHKLKTASTALGREYFGGDVLSTASKQIRDKGGKFYLSDRSTWKP